MAQMVKNLPPVQETWVPSLVGKSLGEEHGNPLQYCCLENPMDRGAWWAAVHGVAKSWTQSSMHIHTYMYHLLSMHTHACRENKQILELE